MTNNNQTYVAIPSAEDLTAKLVKQLKKTHKEKADGSNSFYDALHTVAKILIANSDNQRTISINDFRMLSVSLEIPENEIAAFWDAFCDYLIKHKRMIVVPTCYDYKIVSIV